MKCPVCDKENKSMLCPNCGFDSSRDYGRYPSFGIVGQVPAVSALRKQRQEKQIPKENEDIAVSPHIEPEEEKSGESEKVDISDKVRKWEIPSWLITTAFAVTLVLGVLIGSVLGGGKPTPSEPGESVQMQQPPETTTPAETEPNTTDKPVVPGSTEPKENMDAVLKLDPQDASFFKADETFTIFPQLGEKSVDCSRITWTTSDPRVATVENGVVTSVGKGEATITAVYKDQMATCIVRCRFENPDPDVEQDGQPAADWKVYPHDAVLIAINESFRLKVKNSAGETANAIWSMSTEGIVSIEGSTVTGLATGVVTLRTTIDGKNLSCIIWVVE